ncbi:RNA polymerase sigma-70 factor, ECF subfamily [Sphingobium sp. AP50]|uniref:sigma-70 family RNA polymerase sigma factor n=1 Tax=Sphingobium sp. AP50 TaxID=1884369 RepID=UPI0008B86321|nr:sigma-70 family RNA polymerase sigma factor [Sphingobium sp. AP50]SEJ92061.1 RNA polymerase sigma-70 factor, ECF subfamily [Sphingobium sp. AP50]
MSDGVQDTTCPKAEVSHALIEELYRHESPRLTRFFSRRLRQRSEAQDLTQDAFVRLARARIEGDPLPYLLRIARNLLISRLRQDARWTRLLSDSPYDEDTQLASAPQQAQEIEADDVRRQYQRVIDKLPEKTRRIYIMHRRDGRTYGEIAKELDVHVKTVEYHIASALKALLRGVDQI